MTKVKVLFVCLGNICRSPLAEAIFKDKIKRRNLDHLFVVDSCGTANYHVGDTPDPRTIANAKKNGVEIDHLGRQFGTRDFKDFDHILVMDSSNHSNVMRLLGDPAHAGKVAMMRNFDPTGFGHDVPDPYYGQERHFQEVFDILDRSTENFLDHLEKELKR
ncbi:low molecular weight protein-tyrosine-phosphatase [Chryseolinea lacunae]|uniref:protein-tyrosine-phosphatase n=1 Tax=Chryseolinea lacunae TaxID=2801331 RepID=A0ABS1KPV4_9BACT|nr:low molecular weight protein-tyrosine-phosphatase [Chryseolinea lacunae]MBL0740316.1 low molecular weight phosphotyrosine protein phosphatase [Chryseolinea lacunae]